MSEHTKITVESFKDSDESFLFHHALTKQQQEQVIIDYMIQNEGLYIYRYFKQETNIFRTNGVIFRMRRNKQIHCISQDPIAIWALL